MCQKKLQEKMTWQKSPFSDKAKTSGPLKKLTDFYNINFKTSVG